MLLSKVNQIIAALIFLVIFDALYLNYLAETFDYVGFYNNDRGLSFRIIVYFLSVLPIAFAGNNKTACTFGVNLIYAVTFLPSLLVIQYMSSKDNLYILMFSLILSANMIILFAANRLLLVRTSGLTNYVSSDILYQKIYKIMKIFVVAIICILVIYFRDSMQFVGLQDVYVLREASGEIQIPKIVGYLNLFLTYSCIPFLIGYGLIYKRNLPIYLGLIASLVVYASFGSKIALVIPLAIFILHKFLSNKNPLLALLVILSLVSFCLLMIDLRGTPFEILKSIFAWRTLANSGWMLEKYDEFFMIHGYTYWTHIGIIGRFVDGEITENLQLGQLIGEHYFNDARANYSAGFWISDGVAAAGILGIFVPTIVLSFFIITLNALTRHLDYRLISIWFIGLWLVIMNAPLSVGLIGGGGLLNFLWVAIIVALMQKHRVIKT